jgi:hypothetical protein
MQKFALVSAVAGLVAASSFAVLAAEADGSVASVDPATNSITLNDGNTYVLPTGFDAAALQAGTRVHVIYEVGADGKMIASDVQPST